MIIVSQDKLMIFNFNNIETIGIGNPLENIDGKFIILAETTSDNQYPIAEYKTEERAKEVLKEIVDTYVMIGIDIETYEGTRRQLPIYKMPEE